MLVHSKRLKRTQAAFLINRRTLKKTMILSFLKATQLTVISLHYNGLRLQDYNILEETLYNIVKIL